MSAARSDRIAVQPLQRLAVSPDSGMVHRLMDDGHWYVLDVIPGVEGDPDPLGLVPYHPSRDEVGKCSG